MPSIQHLITNADLPTLPKIVWDVLKLIKNDADLNDIAQLISYDSGLASLALKTANCGLYGAHDNIFDAIKTIGLVQLENLVLVSGMYMALKSSASKTFDLEEFWLRSTRMAYVAKLLCDKLKIRQVDTIHTCALIAHIGEAVIEMGFKEYESLKYTVTQGSEPPEIIQSKILGFNHIDVAVLLFEHWKLPEKLIIPIRDYTNEQADQDTASAILHLANFILADMFQHQPYLHFPVLDKLSTSMAELEQISTELLPLYQDLQQHQSEAKAMDKKPSPAAPPRQLH